MKDDIDPIARQVIDIEAWYQAEVAAKQRDAMIERFLYPERFQKRKGSTGRACRARKKRTRGTAGPRPASS